MQKKKRAHYTEEFKAKVVKEMLKEEKTVGQLAAEYEVHTNMLYRWRDQVLAGLPGLRRTIKYEEVYLKEYTSPREAREGLTDYLRFYNEGRIHQALDYRTPAEMYFSHLERRNASTSKSLPLRSHRLFRADLLHRRKEATHTKEY